MMLFFARTGCRLSLFISIVIPVFSLSGCIPTAPDKTATSASMAAQATPATGEMRAKSSEQSPPMAPTHTAEPGATLKIDPLGKSNASVTVESLKDGAGFSVHGTFNLSGTIVPDGPGKWKFSGQFSVAEVDFAVGTLLASSMGTFGVTQDSATGMSTNAAFVLIDIPVRPPALKAPEGTVPRTVPLTLEIDAPPNAQFTVTLTQM